MMTSEMEFKDHWDGARVRVAGEDLDVQGRVVIGIRRWGEDLTRGEDEGPGAPTVERWRCSVEGPVDRDDPVGGSAIRPLADAPGRCPLRFGWESQAAARLSAVC